MKRIILTGGGTAGHVTPNIALLPRLKELQYDIHYIGSYNGIDRAVRHPLSWNFFREAPPLFQPSEFHRSFSRIERVWGSKKVDQTIKS